MGEETWTTANGDEPGDRLADELRRRFTRTNQLYVDLVEVLSDGDLLRDLGEVPSNSIGA